MSGVGRKTLVASAWLPVSLFVAVAVIGLDIVKWQPAVLRGLGAVHGHGIGASILGAPGSSPAVGLAAGIDYAIRYGRAVWKALLLALVLGAAIQVLLLRSGALRLFAGRAGPARAAGAALPSMMCSCCAAPIAVGLIRGRAQPRSVLVYWLANPVLNPATLLLIGLLLGWRWAVLRLVLGAALVFGLSHLAARLLPVGSRVPEPVEVTTSRDPLQAYLKALFRLAVELVPEYALLVLMVGAVRAWLLPAMTPAIGHAAWLPPLLAAAGTVFVIPTAGEVPMLQSLQGAGLGGSAAAALLLTLPTVSLPSLVMLGRVLPLRVLALLGVGTFGFGLLAAAIAALPGF